MIEEYGIHPNNFALARSLVGDKSDNIEGIKGVGLNTVAKRFPFLKEEKEYLFDDLVKYSDGLEKKVKVHEVLGENRELVLNNYRVIQLSSPMLSFDDAKKIKYVFEKFEPHFSRTEFRKMLLKEGFGEVDFEELFATFNRFVRVYQDST